MASLSRNTAGALVVALCLWAGLQDKIQISAQTEAQAKSVSRLRTTPPHQVPTPAPVLAKVREAPQESAEPPPWRPLTPAQAYCQILKSQAGLTLSGQLKMIHFDFDLDDNGQSGFTALVQSSDCPEGLFSTITIDRFGRITQLKDCRNLAREDLLLSSGVQGNIEFVGARPGRLPLALSGGGYFVTACSTGFYLHRSGDFHLQDRQVHLGGCAVLNREGEPWQWSGEELDEFGCSSKGECPLVTEADPGSSEIIDRLTIRYTGSERPAPLLNTHVFTQSLERLDEADSGPMGPQWDRVPVFEPPPQCD